MGWIKFNNKTLIDMYIEGMPVHERTDTYVVQPNECIKTYDFIGQGEDGFWRYIRDEAKPINQTELPDVTTDPDTWDWVEVTNPEEVPPFRFMVEHFPDYHMPEREYTVTHVPGRNGDALYDVGSYKNVTLEYEVAIANPHNEHTFVEMSRHLSAWLHQGSGYLRLEDSYHPDEYRMAYYKDDGSITNILDQAGRITLKFIAKPQRYLTSGDAWLPATRIYALDRFESDVYKIFETGRYGSSPEIRFTLYDAETEDDNEKLVSAEIEFGSDAILRVPTHLILTTSPVDQITGSATELTVTYDCEIGALISSSKPVPKNFLTCGSRVGAGWPHFGPGSNVYVRILSTTEDEEGHGYLDGDDAPMIMLKVEVKPRWWIL